MLSDKERKELYKLKTTLFKESVIELIKQYNVCISHEDTHGAFKIVPFNNKICKWFNEAEYEEV